MRRILCVLLGIAMVLAMCLPVRHADTRARITALQTTDESARTEQPSRAVDLSPQIIAAPAAGWPTRLAHDALASPFSPLRPPDYSPSVSLSTARLRIHASLPPRTFPLLI